MSNETIAAFLENYNKWRRGDESIEMPKPQEIGEALDCAIAYLRHDDVLIKQLRESQGIKIGKFKLELLQYEGLPKIPDEIWISTESGEAGSFDLLEFEKAIDQFYDENF